MELQGDHVNVTCPALLTSDFTAETCKKLWQLKTLGSMLPNCCSVSAAATVH